MKGLRTTEWQLQHSHEGVKYSTGNIVNNIVVTVCGAMWVLEILGSLCKVYDCLLSVHLKRIQNTLKVKNTIKKLKCRQYCESGWG